MPLRESIIQLVRELRKFSEDVRRVHPEHATPALFAEFQQKYLHMSDQFQDLLIMFAPQIEQLEKKHRDEELERWFAEAFEDDP